MTSKALTENLELSPRTIPRTLLHLQQANIIQRTGSREKSSWLVVKSERWIYYATLL
jgi:predicted HTH transcriptional regulator